MFDSTTKENIMQSLMIIMYLFMCMSTLFVFVVGFATIIKAVM